MSAVSTAGDVRRIHRRGQFILIAGQALAGVGMGGTFSAGALLVTQVSGSEALSGMAATGTTVGAALAAIPLARLAQRAGRAPSLATGALVAAAGAVVGIVASVLVSLPLLLLAMVLVGVGTAVNLQSRFAATDLSEPGSRGRDLAFVVWATTIGAVLGPNLIGPGDALGRAIGLPSLAGPFLFTIAAQVLAAAIYFFLLRPDPLKLAERITRERPVDADAVVAVPHTDRNGVVTGLIALAFSHATMVGIMSMTPVHLVDHGARAGHRDRAGGAAGRARARVLRRREQRPRAGGADPARPRVERRHSLRFGAHRRVGGSTAPYRHPGPGGPDHERRRRRGRRARRTGARGAELRGPGAGGDRAGGDRADLDRVPDGAAGAPGDVRFWPDLASPASLVA
jgi:hypothetical protein